MVGSFQASETAPPPSGRASPVVIAGMHRSGTSFLASVMQAAGIDVGKRLLAPDAGNPRGYFEDADFYDLQLRMLHACTRDEPGFRDWGWTESECFDRGPLPGFRAAARELIERRAGARRAWGWKDPRNALLLDFWDQVLRAAETSPGYLLVYRPPWDVADAMQRLDVAVFREHPEYAHRIWSFYNRPLLEFHQRHRDCSLLVPIGALLAWPERFAALLADRFGLHLGAELPNRLYAAGEMVTLAADDPLLGLVAATSPDAVGLLAELDAAADLPQPAPWNFEPPRRRALAGRAAPAVSLAVSPAAPALSPASSPEVSPASSPAVSIVVPCRDTGEGLVEAVASAERHAAASEIVVVDAGSRQARTLEVLDGLRRAGYPVVSSDRAGLAAALNSGIARAAGRYVLALDPGDRLQAGFVERAAGLLDGEAGVAAVYAGRREVGRRAQENEVASPELDLDRLLVANFIGSCALVRKAAWQACGGYDEQLSCGQDWDLWLALAARGWELRRVPGVALERRLRWWLGAASAELAPPEARAEAAILRKHQALYLERLPNLLLALRRAAAPAPAAAPEAGPDPRLAEVTAERDRLAAQRNRLGSELEAWQERVRAMESTRAWKLRDRLLRLRRFLSRPPGRVAKSP